MTPREHFDAAMRSHGAGAIGVAVSGGGDSLAMLHIAVAWGRWHDVPVFAATVDHGLRAASADEARGVAKACEGLGVPHETLCWTGWNGAGNLQAAARDARRHLLKAWAEEKGLSTVLIGHTADDQAETVLMRLARGSGVDGLAGMPARSMDGLFFRPLLGARRQDLRDYLSDRRISWIEDPSNDNPRFDRVKARQMMAGLDGLGLTVERLVETANHMRLAKVSLNETAEIFLARHVKTEVGDLILSAQALAMDKGDTPQRVLSAALQWVGGSAYRPRLEAMLNAAEALRQGKTRALGGVMLQPTPEGGARLFRELACVQSRVPADDGIWDGRWVVRSSTPARNYSGYEIGALGEQGLSQCAWRESGMKRKSLLASPAVWRGDELIAAPIAAPSPGWTAKILRPFAIAKSLEAELPAKSINIKTHQSELRPGISD